ncbi:MAG: methyl-accepting chemotaxis protein [Pseudomonadota bacterium]
MLRRINSMPLAAKTTAMAVFALLLLSLTSFLVTRHAVYKDAERVASELQESHMRVAWSVLGRYGQSYSRQGETLMLDGRPLNGFNAPVDEVKKLVGGTATIFSGDTRVATNVVKDDGSRAVGTKLARSATYDAVLGKGVPYRGEADILGKPYYTAYDPIKDAQGKVVGVLYVGIPKNEVTAGVTGLLSTLAIATIVVSLLFASMLFIAGRGLLRPLHTMTDAMRRIAAGDTSVDVPVATRADEIGQMATALVSFRDAALARQAAEERIRVSEGDQKRVLDALTDSLDKMARGDLTADLGVAVPEQYSALKGNFNAALAALRTLVGSVLERAEAIRTGSGEIADASEDLARRSETNAASLEETAAAVTQMNERVEKTARAADNTVRCTDGALRSVDTGRTIADNAVQAMGRVAESAKGIDSVIEGVDKIAFQTRVLAMNAAVEAGRAGEAGRGFAVVADLVSALAMRAEEEAKRARDQLTVTQNEVETAVAEVRHVDDALGSIVATVGEVHGLVTHMAEDNAAQACAIGQISATIDAMDRSTQQNVAMVEQTSAAARHLMEQVLALGEEAGRFHLGRQQAPQRAPAQRTVPAAAPKMAAAPQRIAAATVASTDDWATF